ncbi:HD domain-containing protein [Spiroplasma endosymbiont of 'Nebria riversi']|uniref:HD domain-containing protein n=1 Tax=Spiroplasma endosymbiont of 'Nebria riversi' TaxID=2792084 RepID=UPI001C05AC8A|nr:HD domain-containing protein [Spiroplasma endosymbiont of 'Nebria riversi']
MSQWMVRDSIYGNINVQESVIIALINSKEFQRLRRILQLGGGQFAFPSAVHNRFSHSLGVYYLIDKIFRNSSFDNVSNEEKTLTKIAGLLHDLGHGPFSHSFEKVSPINHEQWTIAIIQNEQSQINQVLKAFNIDVQAVCQIIAKTHPNKILLSLVSSQLDCDRMDYLLRDSYHTGVEYGNFDIDWIMENLRIINNEIVYDEKALFAIENYLLGRYHMYWQIYNHKVGISFDYLLVNIFKRLKYLFTKNFKFKTDIALVVSLLQENNSEQLNVSHYLQLDDYSLMSLFSLLAKEEDNILQDLTDRIVNRRFFKLIPNFNANDLKNYQKLLVAGNYDLDYYLIIEEFNQPTLYQQDLMEQPIKLVNKNDVVFNLEKKSKLINTSKQSSKQVEKQQYVLLPKEVLVQTQI